MDAIEYEKKYLWDFSSLLARPIAGNPGVITIQYITLVTCSPSYLVTDSAFNVVNNTV
jgi:hypothetical protein